MSPLMVVTLVRESVVCWAVSTASVSLLAIQGAVAANIAALIFLLARDHLGKACRAARRTIEIKQLWRLPKQ
jgi:hypothetical protein